MDSLLGRLRHEGVVPVFLYVSVSVPGVSWLSWLSWLSQCEVESPVVSVSPYFTLKSSVSFGAVSSLPLFSLIHLSGS